MTWLEQFRTANWGQISLTALVAYVIGCFTTGYYLVRSLKGMDIRTVDSGSVGARNVCRVLGRMGFLLTTLGDGAKGFLVVWGTIHLTHDPQLAAVALLAVVVGHIWPAQLRFHGGKGVATSLGALLIYDPRLAVVYLAIFLCGCALLRRTILPGLFAYVCLPAAGYWLDSDGFKFTILTAMAVMVLFAHRANFVEEIPALAARRGLRPKPNQSKL